MNVDDDIKRQTNFIFIYISILFYVLNFSEKHD